MNVFFSYSQKDEDLRDELATHLALLKRSGKIHTWYDREILPGGEWAAAIHDNLEAADIILLLVSPAFIASDFCWDVELKRAMERHEAGTARVIPIILRPCDWQSAPFGKLQGLPRNGRPVTEWSNRDQAYLDVARGLRAAIDDELGRRPAGAGSTAPAPARTAEPSQATVAGVRAGSIKATTVAGIQVAGADAEIAARLAEVGITGEVTADEIEAESVAGFQLKGPMPEP